MKKNLRLIVSNDDVVQTPRRGALSLVVDNTVNPVSLVLIEESFPNIEEVVAKLKFLKSDYLKKVGLDPS